jgi:hypothetical protein
MVWRVIMSNGSREVKELESMGITKEQNLRAYLGYKFYPPIPRYGIDSTMAGFKKYWAGKSTLEDLREACYLREISGLYQYFQGFLNKEDGGDC